MADELNRDVVGARIDIDTSKILSSFKNVDAAIKKNAQAFQELNSELVKTEQHYASVVRSMDKMVLTSDERRKKILDESQALVAQREASARLLNAKREQLDTGNKLIESKLQTQQEIQKKQQASIEQQEREHSQRMTLLQAKTNTAASNENLVQARIDRQFQLMKNGNAKLEMQAAEHLAKMAQIQDRAIPYNTLSSPFDYLITGTIYYKMIQTAREAIQVNKDFEFSLVNVKRVMGDTADVALVKSFMIDDAKEYGYALKEVGNVYTQIAQQGFNEKETADIAKTALMAANVEESFKGAANAQQLMTGALLNYNIAASESERLLDRLNEVSNEYATDSNKLLQGINRVGSAADDAGVTIDKLIGYLTVLNKAGFSGSVAGNAIKSFISYTGRDIAIDKLEKYVGTIKQANGEMMPFAEMLDKIAAKWGTLSDVERREITQAAARGDQASRFIALMKNYDQVMKVATTSENSFGSAQRENALTMTTLQKQSMQMQAAWEELMISIGDSGLLGIMKEMVRTGTLLVDGFNSLPTPIRNTLIATLALGGAILALNTGARLLTGTSLVAMITGLVNSSRAMLGLKTATDAVNVSQKAFIATPIGATLTAISVVLGVATTAWAYYNGSQNQVNDTTRQNARDTYDLTTKYDELKRKVDSNTGSDKELKQAKEELKVVIEKISSIMPNLISQWDEHGKAIDVNVTKLEAWKTQYADSMRIVEQSNITKLTAERDQLTKDIAHAKNNQNNISGSDLSLFDKLMGKDANYYQNQFASEVLKKGEQLAQIEQQLKNSQETLDLLNGKTKPSSPGVGNGSKGSDYVDEGAYDERKQEFSDRMSEYRHLINMETEGYKDAAGQKKKLLAIRKEFSDLSDSDLYSIDEEIYRLSQGKSTKAKGLGNGNATKDREAAKFPLDKIDQESSSARELINTATSLIDFYQAKSSTFSKAIDQSGTQIELYKNRQNALHESNSKLRNTQAELSSKQSQLNQLYQDGKITLEEYSKFTQDVQSRITSLTKDIDANSTAWWKDAAAIQQVKDQKLQESFSASEEFIRHNSAIGQMSAEEYYQAWLRVQQRYDSKSSSQLERDLRKKADEQVYAARQKLRQEDDEKVKKSIEAEEKLRDDLYKKQVKGLQDSKKAELDAIEEARKRFVDAQNARIEAIDQEIKARQRANSDIDYETELAEKKARLALLQSAVGKDGIKEREDLAKEIERMQLEHARELEQRSLEAQKEQLEKEKNEREKAFDQEKDAVTDKYDVLLNAFDEFKDDVSSIESAIKDFRVTSNTETNKEILSNLDSFIAEYKSKMASVQSLNQSLELTEEDRDLQRYNANIDKWYTGDAAARAAAHKENEELRKKYNITQDNGKLDHFADGGVVEGRLGEAKPIVAHAGEVILNDGHQKTLFNFINAALPRFNYRLPDVQVAGNRTESTVNHYTLEFGDVSVEGSDDLSTFFDQADGLFRRFQSRAGVKS